MASRVSLNWANIMSGIANNGNAVRYRSDKAMEDADSGTAFRYFQVSPPGDGGTGLLAERESANPE